MLVRYRTGGARKRVVDVALALKAKAPRDTSRTGPRAGFLFLTHDRRAEIMPCRSILGLTPNTEKSPNMRMLAGPLAGKEMRFPSTARIVGRVAHDSLVVTFVA